MNGSLSQDISPSPCFLIVEDSLQVETPTPQKNVCLSEEEYTRLKREAAYWKSQHGRAVGREKSLKEKLDLSMAQVRDLRKRIFSKKSEKKSGGEKKKSLIDKKDIRPRGQQTGAKGHGRTLRPDLPIKNEEIDLTESEKCCSTCGLAYKPFPGTEDSEIVEIQIKAHIRRVQRKRYTPGCQCRSNPGVITAPPAPRPLPRNPYGVSVWTEIFLQKYLYSQPTNQLLQSLETLGLPISQGSITGGLKRLSPLFEPLIEAFHEKQMTQLLFHADETRWMVFEEVEGKVGYRWYLWVFRSESVVYYRIADSRATKVPLEHFGKLTQLRVEQLVILVCDRYSAYKCLAKQIDIITLAFCWAHVRRDFLDAATSHPDEQEWMLSWVDDIGNLYHINKKRVAVWDKKRNLNNQSSVFLEHHAELQAALADMETRRDEYLRQEKPSAPRKKVLTSLKEHWNGLTVFVDHPQTPMDNNNGENSIRNPVVGRKNYYGSGSEWSSTLAAMMFTLLQTIKLWGINPHHWLTCFLTACAENGGTPPEDLSNFIPWSMDEEFKRKFSLPMPPPNDTS